MTDEPNDVREPRAPGSEPSGAGPPVNKLHEWALAVALMVFLTGVLAFFLAYFRGHVL